MKVIVRDEKIGNVVLDTAWEDGKLKSPRRFRIKLFDDKELDGFLQVLLYGLVKFYAHDATELFEGYAVDERAMVGCIYRYMYCAMEKGLCVENYPDIDSEYNRMMLEYERWVEKSMRPCEQPDCPHAKECYWLVEKERKRLSKCKDKCEDACVFRPDIILHRRNTQQNGLIVEVKKSSERDKRRLLVDHAKVRYCSCAEGVFHYRIGATVLLSETKATINLYRGNGDVKRLSLVRS